MHRDVLGLVALDFILWIIRARMMSVTLVIDVFCTHLDDLAADMAGLRVSGHVIAYLKKYPRGPFSSHRTHFNGVRGRTERDNRDHSTLLTDDPVP